MGSEEEVEIDGEQVRARIYPWGVAIVDEPEHSDFVRLKSAVLGSVHNPYLRRLSHPCLFSSHLQDLKSLTEDVLYETYRNVPY